MKIAKIFHWDSCRKDRHLFIVKDPVIFAGTVRFNIDPFGNHSDAEIWTAIESVYLKGRIGSMENGLSHLLTEGGENLRYILNNVLIEKQSDTFFLFYCLVLVKDNCYV